MLEVVLVFAKGGIVGRERDEAALGEFQGVVVVPIAGDSGGLVFADGRGWVEAEDRRKLSVLWGVGKEQPGVHLRVRVVGVIGDSAANEIAKASLFERLDVERRFGLGRWERAHHSLDRFEHLVVAALPVGDSLDGLARTGVVDEKCQVLVIGSDSGGRFRVRRWQNMDDGEAHRQIQRPSSGNWARQLLFLTLCHDIVPRCVFLATND